MNDSRVNWQVLIVDDEKLIHDVLSMNIRDMVCNDRPITLIEAYSANEAKNIIDNNPDIAVIILDVMMEQDDAGLNLVKYIREELKNIDIRILLHTGQPGIAPKREVSEDYMIDAYLDKNMSDNDDCYVAVKLAIRRKQTVGIIVGTWFLIGGITVASMIGTPLLPTIVDLAFAYFPFAWLGLKLAK